jgi:exodeoxyribonuclease VIII
VLGNRKPPTKAMEFGTAFHLNVLEPQKFSDMVLVSDFSRNSTIFKEVARENVDKIILKSAEMDTIHDMHGAVMNHDVARGILESDGGTEQSYFWEDEETGLLCKARPDKTGMYGKTRVIIDLKTALSAEPGKYAKAIHNFGHHISASMYLEGTAANKDMRESFVHIAVEKEPPYLVSVFNLDQEMLSVGSEKFHDGLKLFRECLGKDSWPSYSSGKMKDISLPRWAV